MAKLTYMAITSLDGYIEDEHGQFDWVVPSRPRCTIVYSRTLDTVWTPRTRREREFDPEAVRGLKDAATGDLTGSGPGLAEHAFRAGLVDEVHLFVFPIIVGGGKPGLPGDIRVNLDLLDARRFGNGVVHMHHRTP